MSKMKIFHISRTPLNLQKCLLPDCEFVKENYGRHCLIAVRETFLVKIGLNEIKNIKNVIYFDPSVYINFSVINSGKRDCRRSITLNNVKVLKRPVAAKKVNVIIVFSDVFYLRKYCNCQSELMHLLSNVLKLFTFLSGSIISLSNLDENQKFGISSLVITVCTASDHSQPYEVDSCTEIVLEEMTTQLKFNQLKIKSECLHFGSCKEAYEIINKAILMSTTTSEAINCSKKILLIGPSGCGKSSLVRHLSYKCKSVLLELSSSELNSAGFKENKLGRVLEEAKIYTLRNESCVILIKNIDQAFGKKNHSKKNFYHLMKFLDDAENVQGILVIATTSTPDNVDMQLRKHKRFEDDVQITMPNQEEREDIIRKIFKYKKIKCSEIFINKLVKWTPGFVTADINLLVNEALLIFNKLKSDLVNDENTLLAISFNRALKKVTPTSLKGATGLCTTNKTMFSEVGGLDRVKKILNMAVTQQLENPHKFQNLGIPLTKGILLYGPPGCAKTTLVKALAKENNMTFLATSAADLYSPYVGDAEKKIVQLFTQARLGAPAIIFIDEIDAVVGNKSGDRERGVQERILSTLLVEMDGVGLKVNVQRNNTLNLLAGEVWNHVGEGTEHPVFDSGIIIIGATNHPQLLDEALKRPGRFDKLIYIPPPNKSERLDILRTLTRNMRLHKSVDLMSLAEKTNFYSGADLKNLCQESGLHALGVTNMGAQEIQQSDFEYVMDQLKPSLNEKIIAFYESYQKYNN